MSLIPLDPSAFVPENVKVKITDGIFSTLARMSEKIPKVSQTFESFKSDADLQKSIDQGIERGTLRFTQEYMEQDEDLVTAIAEDESFWQSPSVRDALLELVQNPTVYLEDEHAAIATSFSDILAGRVNRQRVDRAVSYYLRCVAESLWHIEPFHSIYEMQMQRLNAETATKTIQTMQGMHSDLRDTVLALVDTIGQQQKLLANTAPSELSTRPTVLQNLPQREYTQFIGRDTELSKINEIRIYSAGARSGSQREARAEIISRFCLRRVEI